MVNSPGENREKAYTDAEYSQLVDWLGVNQDHGVVTDYLNTINGFGICVEYIETATKTGNAEYLAKIQASLLKWTKNFVPYKTYLSGRINAVNRRIFGGKLDEVAIDEIVSGLMTAGPVSFEIENDGQELASRLANISSTDEAVQAIPTIQQFADSLKAKTGRSSETKVIAQNTDGAPIAVEEAEYRIFNDDVLQLKYHCEMTLGRKLTFEELSRALYLKDLVNNALWKADNGNLDAAIDEIKQIIGNTKILRTLVSNADVEMIKEKAKRRARRAAGMGITAPAKHGKGEYRI